MGLDASHQSNQVSYTNVNNRDQSLSVDSTPPPSPSGSHQSGEGESDSIDHRSAISTNVGEETTEQATNHLCSISNGESSRAESMVSIEVGKYRRRRGLAPLMRLLVSRDEATAFGQWFSSFRHASGNEAIRCLETAYRRPPISADSLAELEIESIIANPKLRHDINFDIELHFRPNHDGDSGHRKQQLTDDYWHALEAELEIYYFMLGDAAGAVYRWTPIWTAEFKMQHRRLPGVITAIKCILFLMVPRTDKHYVNEILDQRLIMQQIEHGTTDLASLAMCLAKFLKVHCAPIRDRWIDQMVKHISRGVQEYDPGVTVKGLKMIFGIMEAMKLDVANHQIRHLRPALLNATTHFEQVFHKRRIAMGHVDVAAVLSWYRQPIDPSFPTSQPQHHLSRFVARFIRSLLPLKEEEGDIFRLPQTFRPDNERLYNIRTDIVALVLEETCILQLKIVLQRFGRSQQHVEKAIDNFREVLPIIVAESSWEDSLGHIAVEIARMVATESIPDSWSDRRADIRNPKQSSINEHELCIDTEDWLERNMHLHSDIVQLLIKSRRADIRKRVLCMTEKHVQMTPMQMFDSLVSGAKSIYTRSRRNETTGFLLLEPNGTSGLHASSDSATRFPSGQHAGSNQSRRYEDICRRITHIVALHWTVWAPILYLKEDYQAGDASPEDDTDNELSTAVGNAQEKETPEASDEDHSARPLEQK